MGGGGENPTPLLQDIWQNPILSIPHWIGQPHTADNYTILSVNSTEVEKPCSTGLFNGIRLEIFGIISGRKSLVGRGRQYWREIYLWENIDSRGQNGVNFLKSTLEFVMERLI